MNHPARPGEKMKIASQVLLAGILLLVGCVPPPVRNADRFSTAIVPAPSLTPTERPTITYTHTTGITASPTLPAPPSPTETVTATTGLTLAAFDTPTPSLAPTETPVPPTETSENALPPTAGPSPTRTRRPSSTPTATPRQRIPLADVLITKPGHLSRLTSPFTLESSIIPSPGGSVRVELLGEDGRLLMRSLLEYNNAQDYRLPLNMAIEYDIPGVAETARLQIIIQNARDEIVYVSSVEVILLSIGDAERNPPGDNLEPFFIQRPWSQQMIQGGNLQVSGYLRPLNDQPLIFELYTDSGELAASKQVNPDTVINGEHYPFQLDLPYSIPKATWARLFVRQAGGRIPGDAALNSVQVWLKP